MDTFDLKWPQSDATFYTDGWRCRIVWRERRGGLGGTIDNNDQCKKRAAGSLTTAPYLLNALRARGHGLLAEEIATLAQTEESPSSDRTTQAAAVVSAKPALPKAAPRSLAVATKPAKLPSSSVQISRWLQQLEGSNLWQSVAARRARDWQTCADLPDETLLLKAPTAKGKQEWVLKRDFSESKRKAEYIVAADLKGICDYLHKRGLFADANAVDAWLTRTQGMKHAALTQAAAAWRDLATTH